MTLLKSRESAITPERWKLVSVFDLDFEDIRHLDGVAYYNAPLPLRIHRCRPQSAYWFRLEYRERCACGSLRLTGGRWLFKNRRRKAMAGKSNKRS